MAQMNFYVPEDVEEAIRREARSRRKSVSAFLAEVVKGQVKRERWHKDFFTKVVGGWKGRFPEIESLPPEERPNL